MAIPFVAYFLLKGKIKLKLTDTSALLLIIAFFTVWMLPGFLYENPHWSGTMVLSQMIYAIAGFFAAQAYGAISQQPVWGKLWPVMALVILGSTFFAYRTAFGSIAMSMNVSSSSGFIFNTLYGGVFSEEGKGLRHTMSMAPVLLIAFSLINFKFMPLVNIIVIVASAYLVFFSFSRSAWLALVLIMALVLRALFQVNPAAFAKMIFVAAVVVLGGIAAMTLFPGGVAWFADILLDRIFDSQSTGGRAWVIGQVLFNTELPEWLAGYNREIQQYPHNYILDGLMQSGFLGFLGPLVIVVVILKNYGTSLLFGTKENILYASLLVPALVRCFTAGGGLHIAELFALFTYFYFVTGERENERGERNMPDPGKQYVLSNNLSRRQKWNHK